MEKIFQLSRPLKRLISVFVDSLFVVFAFWFAMFLRLDVNVEFFNGQYWAMLLGVVGVSIVVNIHLGLYRAVIRYLGTLALSAVFLSTFISAASLAVLSLSFDAWVPRSIPVIYGAFLLIMIGGSRYTVRALANRGSSRSKQKVIVYGAGASGIQLVKALRNGAEFEPIAFVDDNKMLQGLSINNLDVFAQEDIQDLVIKHNVTKVLLAVPSASRGQRAEILNRLESLYVEVLAIPGMSDLVSGRAKIDDFVEVSIEDLLGRDQVPPNQDLMYADIKGKVVMVTGAGGSIGSELCRQIVNQRPTALVLFELTEFALYNIHQELEHYIKAQELSITLYPMLGSVAKQNRLEKVMSTFGVQTVYHAAAYKHVPMVEHNVIEGVRNNIFGTLRCAQAAINVGVETFVLISTDKAVRPTNVMGTTKRMAELCLQALADKSGHNTRFCMVRFGNVLGSSGSVVPLFKKQIAKGGPITLTHRDITRYFMTIPEAAQLVIQAGAMGMGGDVFVLDMGKPVKIYDLALKMVHLSGLHLKHDSNPFGDIEIVETGLRPGEKLYEELLIGEDVEKTGNERIMTAQEVFMRWEMLSPLLERLHSACCEFDQHAIRQVLLDAPTGFQPADGICDLVYLNQVDEVAEKVS
ncbi:nucleoside-diphosphate sugar epimerase/dehydratase [Thalassotalea sp. Y01]|uniref:polysaccharide biosynthesis protein n=1 Tax=Thalassotalea sp. Y01 TaxID=2729613 RepID=UPI00145FBCC3|nr:nucleoside-diphosphate sugar epimerase/dehydratase [Thalassotalea sp. Y01]NMP16530.1 polysaccharide biosynthesis protein [Thalassotalea sp. Y01]